MHSLCHSQLTFLCYKYIFKDKLLHYTYINKVRKFNFTSEVNFKIIRRIYKYKLHLMHILYTHKIYILHTYGLCICTIPKTHSTHLL